MDSVFFYAPIATDKGLVNIEQLMYADTLSTTTESHVTLNYDLRGLSVVPGIYAWDLMLCEENGAVRCLMPASGNFLRVYRNLHPQEEKEAI